MSLTFSCVDYSNRLEFYFSSPQTWILWAVIDLHDYLMFFLLNILIVVLAFSFVCLYIQQSTFWQFHFFYPFFKIRKFYEDVLEKDKRILYFYNKYKLDSFNHAPLLEFFWTLTPTAMLFLMGWPSFKVLYAMEQLVDPIHTIVIIGNQWFRTYNYSDFDIVSDLIMQLDSNSIVEDFSSYVISNLNLIIEVSHSSKKKLVQNLSKYLRKYEESKLMYDCVILPDENLPKGYPRLLSTDQVLVLPAYVSIRLLVTSIDVIHSWALPSHGIKMDAIPGRINQINFLSHSVGTFWGQCSESCGINHGFMPIEVRVLPLNDYLSFISLNISYRQDKMISLIEKFFVAFWKREQQKFFENTMLLIVEDSL